MLYGAAYYPEHREYEYWEYDLDNMTQIGFNTLRVGEFAWKRFEPEEGVYDFEWMDTFMELAAKRGIKLLLCPPLRTVPAWLLEKDPSIKIENNQGVRLEYGSRYNYCINHPLLRKKGLQLAREMAKHYGKSKNIVGWHLDNEYGDEADCHCPICTAKWHEWLEKEYKDIDELNKKWGTVFWGLEYDKFTQIPTTRLTRINFNPAHIKAWRKFKSDCTIEMVGLHADIVREFATQPITSNNQPIWNNRTDYYKMAAHLDIAGTNYYPPFGENCRAISFGLAACRGYKGKGFQVHELRNGAHCTPGRVENTPAPGEVERTTMHAIGNGADATYYFRYKACPFGQEQAHGTLVGYDGKAKRIFNECKITGSKIKKISPYIDGSVVISDVAVLYDFPTRWTLEQESGWNAPASMYTDNCKKVYNVIRNLGRNCDIVGRYNSFYKYKVLVVPNLTALDGELVNNLCEFVEKGGVLIWHPFSGLHDEDCRVYPRRLHPNLAKVFGVDVAEFVTKSKSETLDFRWNDKNYNGVLFGDLPVLEGAKRLGDYTSDWYKGTPCITKNIFGQGSAYYIATFANPDFYNDFLEEVFLDNGIKRILDMKIQTEVEVVERTAPDGTKFTFLLNTTDREQIIVLNDTIYDIYNDEKLQGKITIKPYGVRVLKR